MDKILISNGIRMAYQEQGSGAPLLLISGVGYGGWYWHRLAAELARYYRVITFDNRGAGDSDKPAGPYDVALLTADTIGLLEQLVDRPAAILGHSLGGFIAQELVLTRPELVARLILIGTSFGGPNAIPVTPAAVAVLTQRDGDPQDLFYRGMAISTGPGFVERHPDLIAELYAYRATNPVPAPQYAAQVAAGLSHNAEQRLATVACPTLVLSGSDDNVVPAGNVALLGAAIPGARTQILPGLGHHAALENQLAVLTAIRTFLEETGYE